MLNFIVNPHAKAARAAMEKISERLAEAGVPYDIHGGESQEDVRARIRALSEEGERVFIAVGGDGTVNDVLSSVKDPAALELGIIPVGTGNDFAAAAKIPAGLSALDLILEGRSKFTDYIEFDEGFRSLNIAGLGIDVYILEQCYRMKFGRAKSKYFRSLLSALAKYRGQRVMVEVNGEQFSDRSLIACICNGTQFGGGIPICPPADIEDGKLDLFVASCPSRVKIPFLLIKLMRGKILNSPVARHILCESVRIVQVEGKTAQFDGELAETRTLTARVVHEKLKVFRP